MSSENKYGGVFSTRFSEQGGEKVCIGKISCLSFNHKLSVTSNIKSEKYVFIFTFCSLFSDI